MQTGTANFIAKTSGLKIEEFSVESSHPNINSIKCSISDDGMIKIDVNLEEIYYEDWPVEEVLQEVQQFVFVLSFEFDSSIHSLKQSGYTLKRNDESGLSCVSKELVAVFDIVSCTLIPGDRRLDKFKQTFREFRQSSYLRMYSSAIQQEDPIARFMFLYNIILTLNEDRQAAVDNSIFAVAPETPKTPSPVKPNVQETLYTRLRNEIAHNRVGADFSATSAEVSQWVEALRKITKKLVLASC